MVYTINRFSSVKSQKIETNIRNRLLNELKKAQAFGNKSLQQLRKDLDSTSTASLLISTYVNAKQYESLDSIQEELNEESGRTETQLLDQAVHAYRYSDSLLTRPFAEEFSVLLADVNKVLSGISVFERTDERVHDAIGDILSCLLDYAQACADRYEEFRSVPDSELTAKLTQVTLDLSNPNVWTQAFSVDLSPIMDEYSKLYAYLQNPDIYPEVIKFILARHIGSYGFAHIPDLSSPVILTVLPQNIKDDWIEQVWSLRYPFGTDDPTFIPLKSIDDSESLKLASSLSDSISKNSLHDHRDHAIKRGSQKQTSNADDDDDEQATLGMSFSHTPLKRGSGKKKDKQKEEPQQPQLPDDSSYQPDPILASLAKDFTKAIIADPVKYDSHFHMVKFNTTTEAATTVSRSQLTRSDWTVIKRDRYGNQSYLVTYTKKSHKPIFSFLA